MAKKKEAETKEEKKEKKSSLEDMLGTNFVHARHILDRKNIVIPVSPQLDVLLNGGIEDGSFVVIAGPPGVGKTTTAIDFAGTAQDPKYADKDIDVEGRIVYIFNIEGRLKKRDLLGIHHFNIDRCEVIESHKGKILHAEDYIEIGEQLINERPGCVFIFDSFSQLCTKARKESSIGDRFRDDTPLLLANFCKRICNVIPVNNSIVIGITHMIANQGGMGMSPWSEASGRKVQYAADVKLKATHKSDWMDKETQIGQDVHWDCEKSALWSGSHQDKVTSKLRYGYGLDKEAELVELASELGVITKGGSWYTFDKDTKMQGLEKARNYLIENPNMYTIINTEVRHLMGLAC